MVEIKEVAVAEPEVHQEEAVVAVEAVEVAVVVVTKPWLYLIDLKEYLFANKVIKNL